MIWYEDHIWELCDEHEITVRWHRGREFRRRHNGTFKGQARSTREITLGWHAEGEDAYFVALHEIAHIVLDHLGLPGSPDGTAAEAECWAWALDTARCAPSARQAERVLASLMTYSDDWGYHPHVHEVHERYVAAHTAWMLGPASPQREAAEAIID